MTKKPNLGQINSPVFSVGQLNEAFTKIDNAFENTLSLDGSTPNAMNADLDMNTNDVINVGTLSGTSIDVEEAIIGGKLFTGTITWRSDWTTSTSYQNLDVVRYNGDLYICLEEHTSGTFATDLSSSKWELFVENSVGPEGPQGDSGADGPAGQGVPTGGTTGQVLAKIDGTNYNTEWVDQSGGAGVTDGDKGDITVSSSGTTWTIDNNAVTLAKMADMATSSLIYRKTGGTGDPEVNTLATLKTDLGLTGTNSGDQTSIVGITGTKSQFDTAVTDGNFLYVGDVTESIIVAVGDENTELTSGTGKVTFRMPYAFTLTDVRASLTVAQSSGSIFTVDINEEGTSILSTKLTIDNTEKTSTTASTPAVISDTALADDAEITIDIDQIGNGTAVGLKVVLIGHK